MSVMKNTVGGKSLTFFNLSLTTEIVYLSNAFQVLNRTLHSISFFWSF